MTPRAVIYARYSTDMQRDASIDDQVRVCRARIAKEGWTLVEVYADAATSGASGFRPNYQAMRQAARDGAFDIVVAEALDRLSRDQEDIAGLYKHLSFAGVRIITLAEGEISEMHIGLKGTMNALFLKDLGAKTRRGLEGGIAAGKSAGGLCYGYSVVRQTDARGELIRGDRAINPAEASVVQRIFQMFAEGSSPIAIAKALNTENVPGPGGRAWRDSTIRGHAARGTGILRNELYVGRLVWDRMHFLKDPQSGKRVSRPNAEAQRKLQPVPELRIVEQDLWDAVQSRHGKIRAASGADAPDRPRYWDHRRAQHVLTNKVFCGCCGGAFSAVGKDYLACTTARRQGVCDNRQSIRRQVLEGLVLEALKSDLMEPEHTAAFVAEFVAEWNRRQADNSADRSAQERELIGVRRKLDNLTDAIGEGTLRPSASVQQKIDDCEARQIELERALSRPAATAPRLHPNLAEVYRQRVANLQSALAGPDGTEALERLRALIEKVVLHPASEGRGFQVELTGAIIEMLRIGAADQRRNSAADRGLFEGSVKVVAGAGFEPAAFRL